MSLGDDLNQLFAEPQRAMTELYQEFLRQSGATWNGTGFVVGMLGVYVTLRLRDLEIGREGIELMAPAFQPPAVRILRRRGWSLAPVPPFGRAPVPPWIVPLTALPVVFEEPLGAIAVHSDEPEFKAIAALDPTWNAVVQTTPYAFLACDGVAVTAQIAPPATIQSVHAMVAAVVATARSSGIAQTLAALDGATPTTGGDLLPSFSLAPDGLQIGVMGGSLLTARLGGLGGITEAGPMARRELARAGEPALSILGGVGSVTWPGVERDPTRIRAGVAALRSLLQEGGPYR